MTSLSRPAGGPGAGRGVSPPERAAGDRGVHGADDPTCRAAAGAPAARPRCGTASACWCSRACCSAGSGSTAASAPSCSARATCCDPGRARTPRRRLSRTTGWRVLQPDPDGRCSTRRPSAAFAAFPPLDRPPGRPRAGALAEPVDQHGDRPSGPGQHPAAHAVLASGRPLGSGRHRGRDPAAAPDPLGARATWSPRGARPSPARSASSHATGLVQASGNGWLLSGDPPGELLELHGVEPDGTRRLLNPTPARGCSAHDEARRASRGADGRASSSTARRCPRASVHVAWLKPARTG